MASYGKILKRKEKNNFVATLLLVDDLSKTGDYPSIMKEKYDQGYTQVIINSYLMLKIAERMILDGWILEKLEVDDPSINQNTKIEIGNLLEKIKKSSLNFKELEEYLDWALEEGSIFIDEIRAVKLENEKIYNLTLTSSGIQRGKDKEKIFNGYIRNIVEDFLNGR